MTENLLIEDPVPFSWLAAAMFMALMTAIALIHRTMQYRRRGEELAVLTRKYDHLKTSVRLFRELYGDKRRERATEQYIGREAEIFRFLDSEDGRTDPPKLRLVETKDDETYH